MTSALKILMATIIFSVYVAHVHFPLLEPFNHTEAGKAGLTLTSVRRNQLKTEGTLWIAEAEVGQMAIRPPVFCNTVLLPQP